MKQSAQKPVPWMEKKSLKRESTKQMRIHNTDGQQREVYCDLAKALIGSRLDLRQAA